MSEEVEKRIEDDDKKIELTKEQKLFLAECEEEFKHLYTDDDPEYVKSKQLRDVERKEPPIVDPWYCKQPRNARGNYRQKDFRGMKDRERGGDRVDKHGGRHHMYHRNSRPY
ncbi:GSCOCG00004490001-RA-CDS [Cotesia congregata]|nr:GSCOCG00004490001-RA-CDS [Cotesia congregata]